MHKVDAGVRISRKTMHALSLLSSTASLLIGLGAAPAIAQDANASGQAADDTAVGEIVVTATRGRAQSLQSVPIAVSAISADALNNKGIDNLSNLVKSVPSINVVERGPGQSQVTIRGIASGAFSITETGDRPLVSVYLDDIPISVQGANPDLKVFDLERVEILRGPQGTLYGSGSMAGTIRYITRKPSTKDSFGYVEGNLSTTSHASDPNWNMRSSLNLPVTSDLAVLLAGYSGREAGYIDNLGTKTKDANNVRTTQGRGALRWTGISDLTVDASLLYSRLRTQGLPVAYSGLPAYSYDSLVNEYYRDRMLVGNFTAEYDLGGATITSASSYIDRKFTSQTSGFSYEYLNDGLFGGVRTASPGNLAQSVKTFTEELRVASDKSGPFSWSFGGFYEHTSRDYVLHQYIKGLDAATGLRSDKDLATLLPNDLIYGTQRIRERQFAAFGEVNYKFTPQLDFTAGVRYFNFKQSFNLLFAGLAGSSFAPNPNPNGPTFLPLTQSGKPKATGFNPRFVLSYKSNKDLLVFAEASRGFRYGSVNEPVASSFCGGLTGPSTVGPDNIWNYAVGMKSQFADRKVTFNATAFFIDWNKVQSRLDLYCGYYYRVNQGHVQSKGLELETSFRPFDHFTLSANGSYTDAKAKEDVLIPGGGTVALDGNRAPLSPRWIGAFTSTYDVPLGKDGSLTFSADLQLRGSFYNRFNPADANYRETPSQTIVNASVNYENEHFAVGLFGTNLTNASAYTLIDSIRDRPGTLTAPREARFYGKPRTIGVRTRIKF